ncbi:MAG: 23S rRNA (adenine(2503)-C(2))-methyltransferase RlmN, partial [Gemmataceae bacterium]
MSVVPLPLASPAPPVTRRPLLDVPADEFKAWLSERNQPPMRAKQIRRWLLHARATSFDQMTDLPKGLREELAVAFDLFG